MEASAGRATASAAAMRASAASTVRAENHRFGLISTPRPHTKAPNKHHLLRETLKALNQPGRALTGGVLPGWVERRPAEEELMQHGARRPEVDLAAPAAHKAEGPRPEIRRIGPECASWPSSVTENGASSQPSRRPWGRSAARPPPPAPCTAACRGACPTAACQRAVARSRSPRA
jgi:hypothetical protein